MENYKGNRKENENFEKKRQKGLGFETHSTI